MSERETSLAEDLRKAYDSILKPLKKRHGKKGMNVLKLFALLVGVVMVVGFLTLPNPWNSWFLVAGILLLIGSPFIIFVVLELFSLFLPKRYASWKLGIGPPTRLPPPIAGNPDEVRKHFTAMDPWQFEEEVAAIFGRLGYKTEVTRKGADFGVDVLMWDRAGTKWAVQVKQHQHPIGRPTIQVMPSVARDFRAQRAMVIALSSFTKDAREYAESRGIKLVEGNELIGMYMRAEKA
ncbi:MAG: restriction endonuclease [Thermoplasmata archaeon]